MLACSVALLVGAMIANGYLGLDIVDVFMQG